MLRREAERDGAGEDGRRHGRFPAVRADDQQRSDDEGDAEADLVQDAPEERPRLNGFAVREAAHGYLW